MVPRDYKQKIEFEYISHPYGGLICGYVNVKNRMGGYTGRHPFYAIFSAQGTLVLLDSFAPEELAADQYLGAVSDCHF